MNGAQRLLLAISVLVPVPWQARADGFSLVRSLSNEPHIYLRLDDDQIETVGRLRRLDLTAHQRSELRKRGITAPRTLGVMTRGEPDCGCCIASAFWIDEDSVVIWTERLKHDRDGSAWYRKVRMQDGRYVVDASGNLFCKGRPVSMPELEEALSRRKQDRPRIQVSLSPNTPAELLAKLVSLQRRYRNFGFRL